MINSRVFVCMFFACFLHVAFSQRNMSDSILASPLLSLQYGGTKSMGDLHERYGYFNHLGSSFGYKTHRNYFFGLSGNFLFGNQIRLSRKDLFANLMDKDGLITSSNGGPAGVVLFSRGWHFNVEAGKIIHQLGHNKNSGLFVKVGMGYLNHRIRVETNEDVVPLLEKEYRKGYDRFTHGLSFNQFIGYLFLSNRGFVNFYLGFYLQEGLTRNARNVFFDRPDQAVSHKQRLDILGGFQFGWLIPIYKRLPQEFYYD